MEDQVKWLRSSGFAAAYIGESNNKDRSIIHGQENFNFVYGSPESLAGDSRFRDMFSQDFYRKNTVGIVCDEGENNSNKKTTFRKWCDLVGEIRSLLPGVPLLALTATATAVTRKKIMTLLSFNHGIEIVLRLCESEMLDFTKADTCRRKKMLEQFDDIGGNQGIIPNHLCCDVCA
ncbi:probable ATP-dependent DNA helicase RecS [Montipora capricornis]|uniref:probable ATP-dependent DNA helicase RecS n=1 Tax=Montipora capricornis TaxID=246305 RepID=UPI0035F180F5